MANDEPTNAVLAVKIDAITDLLSDYQERNKEDHGSILQQVLKTNGRVMDLEKAKNMLWGGLIITNIILIPIALTLFIKYLL